MKTTSKDQPPNPASTERIRAGFRMMLAQTQKDKSNLFVSCWHGNKNESDAMWKLYTSHGESICVRTTFITLAKELPAECMMGCVTYIDYDTSVIDMSNTLNYVMHKREVFQHEHEVRAVIWTPSSQHITDKITPDGRGIVIPINLENVVSEVYVSPASDLLFLEVVRNLCQHYQLSATVTQSAARAPPNY